MHYFILEVMSKRVINFFVFTMQDKIGSWLHYPDIIIIQFIMTIIYKNTFYTE